MSRPTWQPISFESFIVSNYVFLTLNSTILVSLLNCLSKLFSANTFNSSECHVMINNYYECHVMSLLLVHLPSRFHLVTTMCHIVSICHIVSCRYLRSLGMAIMCHGPLLKQYLHWVNTDFGTVYKFSCLMNTGCPPEFFIKLRHYISWPTKLTLCYISSIKRVMYSPKTWFVLYYQLPCTNFFWVVKRS